MKRALTNDEVDLLVSFARDYIQFAEEMVGQNYGPYMGGDPHNFSPDPDCSTEEERRRHREACEAWERNERRTLSAAFGFGTTHNRAQHERCRRLRRLLNEIEVTSR